MRFADVLSGLLVALPGTVKAADVLVDVKDQGQKKSTILPSFVSYSIEFSSFPDFAGNLTTPNTFSNNLLDNLGALIGRKPVIRVGGNTQDYALYDPKLKVATNGTYTPAAQDYPTILYIGDTYFESYQTFPNTQYSHGFNLATNTSEGHDTLVKTAVLACKALSGGRLIFWELGNEPDLYKTSAQGIKRPADWNETDYVDEWLEKTHYIHEAVTKNCPQDPYVYRAPSFAGSNNSLKDTKAWDAGLDTDKDIGIISQHNYISGATSPGVTLAGTLMNHTMTVKSLSQYLPSKDKLTAQYKIPYILGETNSLFNQGKPGLSNSFGAALWGIDYLLSAASLGFGRVHLHQGTNYRYQSWQPIETDKVAKGTKAPYYGNIAVAHALGNLTDQDVTVQTVLAGEKQVAHAISKANKLRSMMLINFNQYNYTIENKVSKTQRRQNTTFTVKYNGWKDGTKVKVQRLLANGSDAISGITFDGYSYNYELNNGKPVRLDNVTTGETATVSGGLVKVQVPDSSAVLVVC